MFFSRSISIRTRNWNSIPSNPIPNILKVSCYMILHIRDSIFGFWNIGQYVEPWHLVGWSWIPIVDMIQDSRMGMVELSCYEYPPHRVGRCSQAWEVTLSRWDGCMSLDLHYEGCSLVIYRGIHALIDFKTTFVTCSPQWWCWIALLKGWSQRKANMALKRNYFHSHVT